MQGSAKESKSDKASGSVAEWLGIAVLWYGVMGGVFLLIYKDPSVPTWVWWAAYVGSPVIVAVGIAILAGIAFAVAAVCYLGKKLIHDPFPHFWKAIAGTLTAAVSAPFAFLETEARKADDAREWKAARFYRGFQHALFVLLILAGVFLLGLLAGRFRF